jgi:hypothetical protein
MAMHLAPFLSSSVKKKLFNRRMPSLGNEALEIQQRYGYHDHRDATQYQQVLPEIGNTVAF